MPGPYRGGRGKGANGARRGRAPSKGRTVTPGKIFATVKLGDKTWTLRAPPTGVFGRTRIPPGFFDNGIPFDTAHGFYLRLVEGAKIKKPARQLIAQMKAAGVKVPDALKVAARKKRPDRFSTFLRSAAAFIRANYPTQGPVPGRDVTYGQIAAALDELAPQMKRTPGKPDKGVLGNLEDVFEVALDIFTHPAFIAALGVLTGGLAAPGLAGAVLAVQELAKQAGDTAKAAKKLIRDAKKVADAMTPEEREIAEKNLRQSAEQLESKLESKVGPSLRRKGFKTRRLPMVATTSTRLKPPTKVRKQKRKKKRRRVATRSDTPIPENARRYRLGDYIVDVREVHRAT